MMQPPERSDERDAALAAMAAHVPFDGWTFKSLRRGLSDIGVSDSDAEMLFPGGPTDMIEAFLDLWDRRMEASAPDLSGLGVAARVRAVVAARLAEGRPNREAIRRATSILALPRNNRVAARCIARTVDAIWHAAGDQSTDVSWYTKRATLAAIYAATVLFWLRDTSDDDTETLAFLDRRLGDLRRFGQIRGRIQGMVRRPRAA
jgi:ubiquinone biosynthesis protein COQ9